MKALNSKRDIRSQAGFTLIELMVVIVIIGILVAIALPNFIGAQDRAKISSVKANMHTFQTITETYAVDWGGVYAGNVSILSTEANTTGRAYWKDFTDPFTSVSGSGKSYSDTTGFTISSTAVTGGLSSTKAGWVLYDSEGTTKYFIYGLDKSGNTIQDKGKNLTLRPSATAESRFNS
jgi:prepilin-type N-terminal cleavage/methylation domain-containing protein